MRRLGSITDSTDMNLDAATHGGRKRSGMTERLNNHRASSFFSPQCGACESMMAWTAQASVQGVLVLEFLWSQYLLAGEPFCIQGHHPPHSLLLCRTVGKVKRHNTCEHNVWIAIQFQTCIIKIKMNSTWQGINAYFKRTLCYVAGIKYISFLNPVLCLNSSTFQQRLVGCFST